MSAPLAQLLTDLARDLQVRKSRGLLRRAIPLDAIEGALVRIGGRAIVNWCSNDYLGLSTHPALVQAAARAAADAGVGARASRLLAGTTRWHLQLEAALAAWFGTEAAIVYPSGYLANLGTLGALLSPRDAVCLDRLAHASLFDAVRASRATLRVFRHNDASHLADALKRLQGARRRLIVTEGVFSMEGDAPPLAALVDLARRHDAIVYLDDAHGAFVAGATGRGAPEAAGVSHDELIYMATLGKALGCQGGFVAGPQALIDFLQNRARAFIYTTALAVPVAAAALEALRVVKDEPQRRARLGLLAERMRARLSPILPGPPSYIIPIILGEAPQALAVAEALWQRGFWTPAIRPPTVPEGTARLRLSVTAGHTESQVDALSDALHETLR